MDHRTIDGKYNFITDIYITPGNVMILCHIFERWIDRWTHSIPVEEVTSMPGSLTMPICQGLKEREIYVISSSFRPRRSVLQIAIQCIQKDMLYLPCQHELPSKTTNRCGYKYNATPVCGSLSRNVSFQNVYQNDHSSCLEAQKSGTSKPSVKRANKLCQRRSRPRRAQLR